MIIIYGIKNCDTIKKAFKWLENNNIDYSFHDYKKQSLDENTLNQWLENVSWEILLNKRGTTYRKLTDDIKNTINEKSAKHIMLENLSMIKRPVLDIEGKIIVGFNETEYAEHFK